MKNVPVSITKSERTRWRETVDKQAEKHRCGVLDNIARIGLCALVTIVALAYCILSNNYFTYYWSPYAPLWVYAVYVGIPTMLAVWSVFKLWGLVSFYRSRSKLLDGGVSIRTLPVYFLSCCTLLVAYGTTSFLSHLYAEHWILLICSLVYLWLLGNVEDTQLT